MNINFNTFFQRFSAYIFAILFAYIISTVIFFFLPKSGVEFTENTDSSVVYKKYDSFYSKVKTVINKPIVNRKVERRNIQTLSRYILKGVYSTQSNAGWIIIEEKSSKKSIILEQNQKLDRYTLTKLYSTYVIFENNSNEYKLELPKEDKLNYEIEKKTSIGNENIIVNENNVTVKRNYLNSYVNDLNKVWKDIAIKDVRKNGRIEGFKIFKVNKNSVFGKLGLKQNDVIKSVNGKEINSYGDAFKIYNEINSLDYLTFEVLRNNEIVELSYEID